MNEARWIQIEEIFESVVDLAEDEQESVLRQRCAGDSALANEVRILLQADRNMHGLLRGNAEETVAAVAPPSLIGTAIGHYQIIDKIGAGGMGEVFLADDVWLSRRVAIKFLPLLHIANRMSRIRFLREAQAAARLSDPHIVNIHEISEHEGRPFIVMEFVAGQSMRKRLSAGPIEPVEAVSLVHQICSGIVAAHTAGIVHRDLKPENIVLDTRGRARILDFGIARVDDSTRLTASGVPIGTPRYMAPEQARGERTDARCDIFAIGVILHEMVSGKSPFRRDSVAATIQAVMNDAIPPLEGSTEQIHSIQQIVERATSKDPGDRYQTAQKLLDDLESVISQSYAPGSRAVRSGSHASVKSVAVLCFQTLGTSDDEFLSFGLTEDLIVALSRHNQLRVPSMRAVSRYRNSHEDTFHIARELDAAYVIDGSIVRSGNYLRVNAALHDVTALAMLWTSKWQITLDDLPKIVNEITATVRDTLGISVSDRIQDTQSNVVSFDAEAYELFLRGRYAYEHRKDTADLSISASLYRKALSLSPDLLAARAGLAEILINQGDFDSAEASLLELLDSVRKRQHRADEVMVLRLLTKLHTHRNSWETAYAFGEEGLKLSREMNDASGEAGVLGDLISTLLPRGKYRQAVALFGRILEINTGLGDEEKVADALKNMGKLYRQIGDFTQAQRYYEEALQLARRQENQSLESACLGNLGNVHLCRNDIDTALVHYERALEIDSRLNNQTSIQAWLSNLGHIWDAKGDLSKAAECLSRAKMISEELNDSRVYSHALCSSSALNLKLGKYDDAKQDALKALEVSSSVGYQAGKCSSLLQMGIAQSHTGDFKDAAANFDKAIALARETGLNRHLAWALLAKGELQYDQNQLADAADTLIDALAAAESMGDTLFEIRASAHIAAITVRNQSNPDLSKLQQLVSSLPDTADTWTKISVERLLGEAMLHSDQASSRKNGKSILERLFGEVKRLGIAPEIQRISTLLAAHDGPGL